MRKNLLASLAISLCLLSNAYGQERTPGQLCADVPGQTVAKHSFRRAGETIAIPLRGDGVPATMADCEPVSLELHWANGRNNGSNFNVTFLDGNNKPIYAKQISAFLTGVMQLPLSSYDAQPVYDSSLALISVPTTITIQAVPPCAAPAGLSYSITRVARPKRPTTNGEDGTVNASHTEEKTDAKEVTSRGNEIVSIRNAVRLIGATRLPLVQIELRTSRPFPVRDMPLQLQIGDKVFLDELSGDYTGRRLTLSLTPELFAELKDGEEVVASFSKRDAKGSADQDVWNFGKLKKASLNK